MKISIAMATYNGEKYLREQLASFTTQTHQPDELVVCDDGSNDATVDILRQFAASAPFEVSIHENETNLGYAKNFEKAMSLCSGDIVFLSDQDDVWFDSKLEDVLLFALTQGLDASFLLLNDAVVVDAGLKQIGESHFQEVLGAGKDEDELTLGCCMAMSREFVQIALPFPVHVDGHDKWLSDVALFCGKKLLISKPLQYYRRYFGTVTKSSIYGRKGIFSKLSSLMLKVPWVADDQRSRGLMKKFRHYWCLSRRATRLSGCSNTTMAGFNAEYFESLREEYRFRVSLRRISRWCRWYVIVRLFNFYTPLRGGRLRKVLVDLFDRAIA